LFRTLLAGLAVMEFDIYASVQAVLVHRVEAVLKSLMICGSRAAFSYDCLKSTAAWIFWPYEDQEIMFTRSRTLLPWLHRPAAACTPSRS
jgi:hypothetical protein